MKSEGSQDVGSLLVCPIWEGRSVNHCQLTGPWGMTIARGWRRGASQ